MKILVYPTMMEMGGSQLNAVELAHEAARAGHDVTMCGPRGALVPLVHDLGLPYRTLPREHTFPSVGNALALRRLAREEGFDVVHGYEWGAAVDLAFGLEAADLAPAVTTVYSVVVPVHIPRYSPMVVGTAAHAVEQTALGRRTTLIEPPIDTRRHRPPEAADVARARDRFGLGHDDFVVSVACRMTPDLGKLHGVLEAIATTELLAGTLTGPGSRGSDVRAPRLLVIGAGPGLDEVRQRAAAVNGRLGHEAVVVTGQLLDADDGYAAADVVIGMGSSVLKGMSYGRPVVVQGDDGFWCLLDDASLPQFLQDGWWGHGGGGADALAVELERLRSGTRVREELGAFGRAVVEERFSLGAAAVRLEGVYDDAVRHQPSRAVVRRELVHTAKEVAKYHVARRVRRPPTQALPPERVAS